MFEFAEAATASSRQDVAFSLLQRKPHELREAYDRNSRAIYPLEFKGVDRIMGMAFRKQIMLLF